MGNNGLTKEAAEELIAWVMEHFSPLQLLSAEESEPLLKIPHKTIGYLARSNQIPFVQVGRHLRYSPIALAHWLIEKHGIPYLKPGEREGEDGTE